MDYRSTDVRGYRSCSRERQSPWPAGNNPAWAQGSPVAAQPYVTGLFWTEQDGRAGGEPAELHRGGQWQSFRHVHSELGAKRTRANALLFRASVELDAGASAKRRRFAIAHESDRHGHRP